MSMWACEQLYVPEWLDATRYDSVSLAWLALRQQKFSKRTLPPSIMPIRSLVIDLRSHLETAERFGLKIMEYHSDSDWL